MDIDVKNLHPLEVKLLRHVSPGEDITAERIVGELGYKVGQCNQAFSWLSAKGCIEESSRAKRTIYELTDVGRSQKEDGMAPERIFAFLRENGAHTMPEIAEALSLEKSDVGSAFGLLSSKGTLCLNSERKAEAVSGSLPSEVIIQRSLLDKAAAEGGSLDEASLSGDERKAIAALAKKRGASSSPFRIVEREDVVYHLTAEGEAARKALLEANITGEELGVLTPAMIQSGAWKSGQLLSIKGLKLPGWPRKSDRR